MWSARAWLYRQFPHAPRAVRQAIPRLVLGAFVLVAFLLSVPQRHIAALEGLWFQLGAAALLWYEANARPATIALVIAELRQAPFRPTTFADKVMGWVLRGISWLLWLLAYAVGTLTIVIKAKPERLMYDELKWAGLLLVLMAIVSLFGRLLDRSVANLRTRMIDPLAKAEEEILVRRYLRTVAFGLLIAGTVCQMIETALF
jgi:hypothetical protein